MVNRYHILKNCSIMYRLFQMYYAEQFEPYGFGAGSHYFLCEIGKRPGVTMAELAEIGAYDSGTVTRAVHRLQSNGYVIMNSDERDRRVKRLYLTEKGAKMADTVRQTRCKLFRQVTSGLTQDEVQQAEALLERMAQNTRAAVTRGQTADQPCKTQEDT